MKKHYRKFSKYLAQPLSIGIVITLSAAVVSAAAVRGQQISPAEVDREADAMLSKLTLRQKIKLIGGVDGMFTYGMPSIGLPQLKMSDGPVGVRSWGPSTAYAAGIGLAASWDTALARRIGVSLGHDARARGVNFLLGPAVDIYRLPLNGRNFEYFGEDPYLASRIAVNYIEGVQSQDVVATIKHFALNNQEYDRHNENSVVDQRTLREIYLPTFEAAVKQAHVGAVMDSYNLVNGEHSTQNGVLNNEILKKEWGFRGIVMSDWGGTYNGIASANNGLDLEMPSGEFMNAKTLLPAIKDGKVSVATIDDKVRRILRIAVEFGFINHDQTDLNIPLYRQQSREVALQSAEESMVLLKNKGHMLPLDLSHIHTIALIGPDAYPANASGGGSAHVTPFNASSYLTGLSDALGTRAKVLWSPGVKDVHVIFDGSDHICSKFVTDESGARAGLKEEIFSNGEFTGQPASAHIIEHVNFWPGDASPPLPYAHPAVRWSGYYIPKTSGPQRFIAVGLNHDMYRLYVNHKLVLEEKQHPGQAPKAVEVDLPAGEPAAVQFDYLPQTNTIHASLGVVPPGEMLEPDAVKLARLADVCILSVGYNKTTEAEGIDRTYRLPPGQDELIKKVLAANPRTIIVVTSGGSVATSEWINQTPVLIEGWYGGSEAGRALAQILLGRVDPSGKLPISWERKIQDDPAYKNYYEVPGTRNIVYREGIFLGYRYFDKSTVKPLFPFGFGLSYTTFAFSNLSVTPTSASPNGPIKVSFDVRNTGSVAGADVAQVYVGDPSATVPRPVKELKGFERVSLNPGETKNVTVTLNHRSLAYWDTASKGWKVDPGKFVVYVGDSSENVPLKESFTVR